MEKLLETIKASEEGVTQESLREGEFGLTKEEMVGYLNKLINSNEITVYKKGAAIVYKYTGTTGDDYEALLLNLISSKEGLWLKEIKDKTNMPHNLAMKVLKGLENKRLIKSMKCVKSNRKVYVPYDRVPSDDITGGYWFTDNDVDLECVESLSQIVLNFIKQKSFVDDSNCMNKFSNNPNLYEILDFLNGSQVLTTEIKEEDLKTLLDVLAYDGLIERLDDCGIERYIVQRE